MNTVRQRPFVIPVFLPQAGCPHQCAFCNQAAITGKTAKHPGPQDVRATIKGFLKYRSEKHREAQIAFYGGNFLGLEPFRIQSLLEIASEFIARGEADSIRFSTRPDTVDMQRLALIEPYPVRVIELGVQSMNNEVLQRNRRGHDAGDTKRATALLRSRQYTLGLQMMVGLAGETRAETRVSGLAMADLKPDFVRIYPTLVFEGSLLGRWYREGKYAPLSMEAAVSGVKRLYLMFRHHGIRVIRMGLQSSPQLDAGKGLLAGPYHPAFGHLVHSRIFLDALLARLHRDARHLPGPVAVRVHPAAVSTLRGLHNDNLRVLEERFGTDSLGIVLDLTLNRGHLLVDGRLCRPYAQSESG